MAKRNNNMQWFKVPPKIYFEKNSVQYLAKMPSISKAVIVTDEMMIELGYVDKVLYHLRKRTDYVNCEIFYDVEQDTSKDTVIKGAEAMDAVDPDGNKAIGGDWAK